MSEPPDPPNKTLEALQSLLAGGGRPDQRDQQIAELQDQVQALRQRGTEERFLWVVVLIVVVDIVALGSMSNWSAPLVIGAIEIIGLAVWVDRCGVKTVRPLIDRLSGVLGKKIGGEG